MFDTHHLPATGAWARRLAYLNQFKPMGLVDRVLELAENDLVDFAGLEQFELTDRQKAALQYVQDWNYRCVLLHDDMPKARRIGVAAAAQLERKPVVVITRLQNYEPWIGTIREFTDDSILVLTNPRYGTPDFEDPTVTVSEKPLDGFDWIVTSYGSAIYHQLATKPVPGLMLIDEIEDQNAVNYKWVESVRGMLRETPRCIALQSVRSLTRVGVADAVTCLRSSGRNYDDHVKWWATDGLNMVSQALFGGVSSLDFEDRCNQAGYTGLDYVSALPLLGVNVDLVYEASGNQPLTFTDSGFEIQATENMKRHLNREQTFLDTYGDVMSNLLDRALSGDRKLIHGVNVMKGSNWAYYKTVLVNNSRKAILARNDRVLIYARHSDLVRQLRLSEAGGLDDVAGDRTNSIAAQYLFPDGSYSGFFEGVGVPVQKRVALTSDIAAVPPEMLQLTDYLFLAEYPDTREEYQLIVELCERLNIRLAHFTLKGTFEDVQQALLNIL